MFIDISSLKDMFIYLIGFIPVTLMLTFASMLVAVFLGLITSLSRIKNIPILAQLSSMYVLICRALPTMVVLYIVFFGLPVLFLIIYDGSQNATFLISKISPSLYAILGLGLHTGAYMSEIFRASIQSVPKGQLEGALSIGMTYKQAFFRIILPQAAVFATPMVANQFLNLMKGTSIAFMITVIELFGASTILASSSHLYLEVYFLIALIYWAMSIIAEKTFIKIEDKLSFFKKVNA